jgi:hypothetical protein
MTLTKAMVEAAVPANLKGSITEEFVDKLNNLALDPLIANNVRENFISYTHVLKDGKFKTTDYLSAVMYVSFKLMGLSNKDAYAHTFPDRYQELLARGIADKDISAYVSAYNKGKLVNLILEQSLVPSWVLNADIYQKAINTQAELMMTSTSDKVRCDAANSILTHLKKPDAAGPLINLDMRESSGMNELKAALENMAKRQVEMIEAGVSTKEIAGQRLIEGEAINGTGTDQAKPG